MTIDERLIEIIEELQAGGITLTEAAEQFDRKYVHVALRRSSGNIKSAAAVLGVHRNTLQNRLRENEDLRVRPRRKVYVPMRLKGGR